jgi:low affinity Fe/Cu permease
MQSSYSTSRFTEFAKWVSHAAGHPATFVAAVSIIVIWAVSGPIFGFSDTWQLIINTGTTIVTFLMVFLIQNTQNRDSAAMQIKLDELIRAVEGAHNGLLDLEEMTEDDLTKMRDRYETLAQQARDELRSGRQDTDRPEMADDESPSRHALTPDRRAPATRSSTNPSGAETSAGRVG